MSQQTGRRLASVIVAETAVRLESLRNLRPGQGGRITQINGGQVLVDRLAALDLRPGKRIKKLSSGFMRGPVTVEVDRTQVAIGFGIAGKIVVRVEDTDT